MEWGLRGLSCWLFASAMPQSIFLHLSILYRNTRAIRPVLMMVIYAPTLLSAAALIAVTSEVLPADVIYLGIASAVIYSLIGGMVWIYKVVNSPILASHVRALFVAAFVLGWGPHAMISTGLFSLNNYEGLAAISLILIPIALSFVYSLDISVYEYENRY